MWRGVALGVVLAGVLAGCSVGGGHGVSAGTVSGLVVIEGGKQPPPGESDAHPVKGASVLVTGTDTSGAKVEKHLRCDGHGRFSVALSPGRYTFVAQIFPANPTHPRRSVVVERGQDAHIVLKGYVI